MIKDRGKRTQILNVKDRKAITIQHLSKSFRLPHNRQNSVKSALVNLIGGGDRSYETQKVLRDISFDIKKGEFFGIVGRNGSGKSTLLKILAGIYKPTAGEINVNGSLTPFIELGVGFNPELTGRENVYLNGALLGFNERDVREMYDDIVAFAELEKFMDQKLKNYSSGMQVRLAFSIAIRARSDILLLDEVLAVGDLVFQKKCYDYFRQLKKDKRTVILVSHDTSVLQEYCDRCVLIENGTIYKHGETRAVISTYLDIMSDEEASQRRAERTQIEGKHVGSGEVLIQYVRVNKNIIHDNDEEIQISLGAQAGQEVEGIVAGITVLNPAGQPIFASNNLWLNKTIESIHPNQRLEVVWTVPNVFNSGMHTIIPTISRNSGRDIIDQLEAGVMFEVKKKIPNGSYTNPLHGMDITIGPTKHAK